MIELGGEDKIGLKLEVISDVFNREQGGHAIDRVCSALISMDSATGEGSEDSEVSATLEDQAFRVSIYGSGLAFPVLTSLGLRVLC